MISRGIEYLDLDIDVDIVGRGVLWKGDGKLGVGFRILEGRGGKRHGGEGEEDEFHDCGEG